MSRKQRYFRNHRTAAGVTTGGGANKRLAVNGDSKGNCFDRSAGGDGDVCAEGHFVPSAALIRQPPEGDDSRALAVDDTAIPGNRCFGEGDVLPGGDKRRRGVSKFSHWVSPFKKCGGVKCPAAVCAAAP